MANTLRMITRGGLADRLGLWSTDLNPRRGSAVDHAVTVFYNAQGETLGEHTVRFDSITGGWDHEFRISSPTVEPDEDYCCIWL